jgi:hypothetical protein
VNILCAPHSMATYFRDDPSEPTTEPSKKLLPSLGSGDKLDNHHPTRDPAIIGAEKLIALNPKLIHSRASYPSHVQSLSSPSSKFELNKHSRRLNNGLDGLTNIHTSSSSRTVRNSNRLATEQIEPDLSRHPGTTNNGQYFKSDRRPTLDSVMAHNTPERLKGQLKTSNGSSDPVSYTLTTACIGSSPSQITHHQLPSNNHLRHPTPNIQNNQNRSNHPTSLYPSVPISVNYHERVKSQLA